jgi:hypothetical protein
MEKLHLFPCVIVISWSAKREKCAPCIDVKKLRLRARDTLRLMRQDFLEPGKSNHYILKTKLAKNYNCIIQTLHGGPRVFDSLPSALRQMEDVNLLGFKRKLDNWLANVLDQPTVRGIYRASQTNSIIDQVKNM